MTTRGKFTVNEVEERIKVPASTLRQWERRYGFPKPERSDAGYRLYSEHDLENIRAMKRYIAEGIPASRAAELVKRIHPVASGPRSLAEIRGELVSALTNLDESRADTLLSEAHTLHTVDAVMAELMQGVVTDIGELWHDGKVNIATEHFASSYIQGRLRSLLNITANIKNAPAVVVACAPTEQHELGPLILAVTLRRAGYRVYYVGANTPVKDLRDMAKQLRAVGVLVSASTAESMQQLLSNRNYLAGIAPVLAFGGPAFNEQPEMADVLGGTFLARSVDEAVDHFHDLVQDKGAMRA